MRSIIKMIFCIFLFSYSLAIGQTGNWEIVGRMPIRISGSESVVVDSTIYFLGGYSDSLQNIVDWIYSYQPNLNKWKFVGRLKRRRANFIADRIGNQIYCIGGDAGGPFRPGGTVESFDCNTFNSTLIDSNKQFDREHATGLIKDSTFYIVGGMSHTAPGVINPYIMEYNIPLKKVTYNYIPSFPGMRIEQMSAFLFKNLYIFGGLYNTVSSDIDSYGILDHQLNLQHTGLLRPRANGRAIKLNDSNQVVIIGGYNEINIALNSVELCEYSDSVHFSIHQIQPMNFRRNNFMAVYYSGSIYVFGGLDEFGNPVDKVEKLIFITDIRGTNSQNPTGYKLDQNYPNPFNLSTLIKYYVPKTSKISLKIYDILGREVANLVDEEKQAGNCMIPFNGIGLASGIYYYRITGTAEKGTEGNNFIETKKMILLK